MHRTAPPQIIIWFKMLVVLRLRNLGNSTEGKWEIKLGLLVPNFPETGSLELSKHIWRAYGCSEDRVLSRDSVGRAWVWEMENRGTKDKGDGTIQKDLSLVQDVGLEVKDSLALHRIRVPFLPGPNPL